MLLTTLFVLMFVKFWLVAECSYLKQDKPLLGWSFVSGGALATAVYIAASPPGFFVAMGGTLLAVTAYEFPLRCGCWSGRSLG